MGAEQNQMRDRLGRGREAHSDVIRKDIAHTRSEMDETIDELGERLQPRQLLDEALDWWQSTRPRRGGDGRRAMGSLQSIGKAALQQVREHPVPSLLIGAGIAWLLFGEEQEDEHLVRSRRRHTELDPDIQAGIHSGSVVDARTGEPYGEDAYEDFEAREIAAMQGEAQEPHGQSTAAEKAGSMARRAKEWSQRTKEGVQAAASSVREGIGGAAGGASRAARSAASGSRRAAGRAGGWASAARRRAGRSSRSVAHQAQQGYATVAHTAQQGYATTTERFAELSEDYPLAVGAGFFAAGLLSGLALPSTTSEDRLVGPISDDVRHRASEMGKELVERGQEVVEATTAAAMEEAEAQGLMPQQLGEKAKHAAERLQQSVGDAAREEGLSPGQVQDKVAQVGRHARDTALEESKKHSEEVSGKTTPRE